MGNHMLYDLVNKISNIPYNKLGKWIVAQNQDQHEYLEGMHEKATRLGVPTYFIDQKRANEMEPNIKAHSVLVSSSTGIVDSHNLMDYLEQQISETGDVALNTAVRSIQPSEKGYLLEVATPSDSQDTILVLAKRVFNSAGLHADKVSNMLLGENAYKLYYARGHYYSSSSSSYGISHLIYPCPEKNLAGLGTHLTLDMAGCIKFGPDVQYTDSPYDYSVPENDEHKAAFVNAIQQYLPSLDPNKINPDYSGIR
jgi:L-2-hydroxyglutarate oxidase LhgO